MAIYKMDVNDSRLELAVEDILTTFWFLRHNFGSRYARNQSKGSKDSYDRLVSNPNLSEKIGSLDGRLGPGKVSHKNVETPLVSFPRGVPRPEKMFF